MVEARVRVIYGDTDQMGVVYYANYFRYFELARGEFLRAKGASYRDIEQEGAMLPVVEAHCHYRASARFEDLLVIETSVTEVRRASLTFEYALRREGETQLLCTGKTVHACVRKDGRPTRLPESVLRLLGKPAAAES
jgi:acyl-CoA thioester hydrolase